MLISKPESLPANTKLAFRILDASSERQDLGERVRDRFVFKMQVWSRDLSRYWIVEEQIYSGGRCSDYLVDFVENATGEEFIWFWTDVEFTIDAVFIGMVTVKEKTDYYNRKTVFFNTVALEHLGYWTDEEGDEE